MKKLSIALFAVLFFVGPFIAHAQVSADAVQKRQAELQSQLDLLNQEIAAKQAQLDEKHGESASLQRDISILNAKIDQTKFQIQASNILLKQLAKDIDTKQQTIGTLADRIEKNKESLGDIIRKTQNLEDVSLIEALLSGQDISGFFSDLDSFETLKSSLHNLYLDITDAKQQTEEEKLSLEEKKAKEADAKAALEDAQRKIASVQTQKKDLLTITKGEEQNYALALADRQKKAAQIRSALFSLRDSAAIPFGEALKYALEIQNKLGVRPAFLLAILTQETNLGENVGQCFVSSLDTGAGVGKNTGTFFPNVMKAPRDTVPFADLGKRLGFDPLSRPVSCPQGAGYGGAMGPSQFIASTWAGYEKRVAAAEGVAIPDPWIPRDAFFASGIYLSDLGASSGGFTAERTAALKYYAGGGWYKAANAFYGDGVMAKAANIQTNMIDPLQNL